MSITRAAEELNVTPSAVSHQIKVLEDYLGVPLFHRQKNKLKLTTAGERYMAQVSEALLLLARATNTIKSARSEQILRIAAPASLATLWLVRRLCRFSKAHPDITLTVTASSGSPTLLEGSFDIGFWYGSGVIPGLSIEPLGQNRVFPICKPTLMQGEHALRTSADLQRCTLLDSSDEAYYRYKEPRQPGWSGWLQSAGLSQTNGARQMNLTPRMLMHGAVTAGAGVGLSRSLIAVDGLAAREIAVPFGPALPLSTTYNLVFPSHLAKRKDIAAFREWVIAEAASSTRRVERMLKRYTTRQ
jgi:LysR family glycine cleavage system transcriptional activator